MHAATYRRFRRADRKWCAWKPSGERVRAECPQRPRSDCPCRRLAAPHRHAVARGQRQRLRLALLLLNTLLALPSVVVGLAVYLLLSRSGPLGSWGILFTPTAMVIAQTILVLPVVAALSRQVVADGLRDGGDPLRSLGAGPLLAALLMLLHERWAVVTILLTAFGRAIAEVGAVMIVGGNIEGVTRVMTTAIALETSKGDLPLALALGLVLLAVVALLNVAIAAVQRSRFAAVLEPSR